MERTGYLDPGDESLTHTSASGLRIISLSLSFFLGKIGTTNALSQGICEVE
jgi:hypothetical protein